MYMKHCKVEVYLMEFKLSIPPHYDQVTSKPFSKGDTVGKNIVTGGGMTGCLTARQTRN